MCNLRRKTADGYQVDTAWIPEKFAIKGKFLQIKDPNGVFVNGWEVIHGKAEDEVARDFTWLNERSRDYKKTRVASDEKRDIIATYDKARGFHIGQMQRSQFKIDHYIPLCAGGSNDRDNLWPQH